LTGGQVVAGSNPVSPTKNTQVNAVCKHRNCYPMRFVAQQVAQRITEP
jgi:hypothetical protein